MSTDLETRSLRDDVKLNKYRLEFEAERQADLYAHWSEQSADRRREAEGLENKLDLEEAEVATRVRASGDKVTEALIKERVAKDPQVVALKDQLVEANHRKNLAEAAVRALDHKKSMIETLDRLHRAGYYADPSRNDRSTESVQRHRDSLNNRSNED